MKRELTVETASRAAFSQSRKSSARLWRESSGAGGPSPDWRRPTRVARVSDRVERAIKCPLLMSALLRSVEETRANPTAARPAGAGSRRGYGEAAAPGRRRRRDGGRRVANRNRAGHEQAVLSKIARARAAVGRARARGFACFGVKYKPAST